MKRKKPNKRLKDFLAEQTERKITAAKECIAMEDNRKLITVDEWFGEDQSDGE